MEKMSIIIRLIITVPVWLWLGYAAMMILKDYLIDERMDGKSLNWIAKIPRYFICIFVGILGPIGFLISLLYHESVMTPIRLENLKMQLEIMGKEKEFKKYHITTGKQKPGNNKF